MANARRSLRSSGNAAPSIEVSRGERLEEFSAMLSELQRQMAVQLEVQRLTAAAQTAFAEAQNRQPPFVAQVPVVPSVAEDRMGRVLKEFFSLRPPTFQGGTNPVVADAWFRSVSRLLDSLEVSGERRVVLASHLFEGAAIFWWDTVQSLRRASSGQLLWDEFEEIFYEKFFPPSVRDRFEIEFLALTQGSLSVAEYEAKFSELARYSPHLVNTEARRAKRFVRGLRPEIRGKLSVLVFHDYGEACHRALAVEFEAEESKEYMSERQAKRERPEVACPPQQQQRQPPRGVRNEQPLPRRVLGACFTCGSLEHQRRSCPVRRRQGRSQPSRQPFVFEVQPLQQRSPLPECGVQPQGQLVPWEGVPVVEVPVGFCFRCKQEGHSRQDCPWKGLCFSCGQEGHEMRDCSSSSA